MDKELDSLPADQRAKFLHIVEMIEELGLENIGKPFLAAFNIKASKKVWEIRMKARSGISRAFYVTHSEKRVVILHAFVKKTQKTAKKNINILLNRLKELK